MWKFPDESGLKIRSIKENESLFQQCFARMKNTFWILAILWNYCCLLDGTGQENKDASLWDGIYELEYEDAHTDKHNYT